MLWLVCFINYADRQVIFSVFPLIKSEAGLNDVQLGQFFKGLNDANIFASLYEVVRVEAYAVAAGILIRSDGWALASRR